MPIFVSPVEEVEPTTSWPFKKQSSVWAVGKKSRVRMQNLVELILAELYPNTQVHEFAQGRYTKAKKGMYLLRVKERKWFLEHGAQEYVESNEPELQIPTAKLAPPTSYTEARDILLEASTKLQQAFHPLYKLVADIRLQIDRLENSLFMPSLREREEGLVRKRGRRRKQRTGKDGSPVKRKRALRGLRGMNRLDALSKLVGE